MPCTCYQLTITCTVCRMSQCTCRSHSRSPRRVCSRCNYEPCTCYYCSSCGRSPCTCQRLTITCTVCRMSPCTCRSHSRSPRRSPRRVCTRCDCDPCCCRPNICSRCDCDPCCCHEHYHNDCC